MLVSLSIYTKMPLNRQNTNITIIELGLIMRKLCYVQT